ncbi:hypothetical protein MTO96_006524 [Rhipicephalus appendiculatus]
MEELRSERCHEVVPGPEGRLKAEPMRSGTSEDHRQDPMEHIEVREAALCLDSAKLVNEIDDRFSRVLASETWKVQRRRHGHGLHACVASARGGTHQGREKGRDLFRR